MSTHRLLAESSQLNTLQKKASNFYENDNWVFINRFPHKLLVYVILPFTEDPQKIGDLKGFEIKTFPSHFFTDFTKVFATVFQKNQESMFLLPFTLRTFEKKIVFGECVYTSTDGHLQTQASNYSISKILLRNMLPVGLKIYFKSRNGTDNRLVGYLGGYNGLTYLGGGHANWYFDNNREGINLFDSLEFEYDELVENTSHRFSITIDDLQCQEIQIGVVSSDSKTNGPEPDFSDYTTNTKVWTGITYYLPKPSNPYSSIATNPFAPF